MADRRQFGRRRPVRIRCCRQRAKAVQAAGQQGGGLRFRQGTRVEIKTVRIQSDLVTLAQLCDRHAMKRQEAQGVFTAGGKYALPIAYSYDPDRAMAASDGRNRE